MSSEGATGLSTKNTTRLGGPDPATDAAAVARAVYPGLTASTRPQAVVLVNEGDWAAALAASALASAPLGAPLLYSAGSTLPAVSSQALEAMHPTGAAQAGGAQVIRIGSPPTLPAAPRGYRTSTLTASEPAALAAEVARLAGRTRGVAPKQVIVLASDAPPALLMPAAGLSAESGAPVLLVSSTRLPAPTRAELASLHQPAIYVIDPPALGSRVISELAHLGPVKLIGSPAATPSAVANAIAVARYADGAFGWNIHEPGHGLVFANLSRPLDAPAAALLSASGDFGPLLLLGDSSPPARASPGGALLPSSLASYLSDIKPAFSPQVPPVRVAYNHGWLIGDERAIPAVTQAEIDALLEASPRAAATEEPSLPLAE